MKGVACLLLLAVLVSFTEGVRTTIDDKLADSCANHPEKCCFNASKWAGHTGKRFRCEKDANGTYPCSVKLGVNAWTSSFVNVYVVKIFMEEFLGYPVEIVADYSDWTGTELEATIGETLGQWERLANGENDVILEVWPSGHNANFEKFILQDGVVADGGSLGAVGSIGWYAPTDILDIHDPALEYWRTFSGNELLFKNPAGNATCCPADAYSVSNDVLPCIPIADYGGTPVEHGGFNDISECDQSNPSKIIPSYGGRFIAGANDWVQHDDKLIKHLGLNLTMEWAVTEGNLIKAFNDSVINGNPVVAYFWQPHGLFQFINLTRIMLPPYNPTCYAAGTCDYPFEILYKVYSRAFQESKPDAAAFLSAMRYASGEDQETMLADMLLNPAKSLHDVACSWLKTESTEKTWSKWITAVSKQFADKIWKDEVLTPSYVGCACKSDGTRDIMKYYTHSDLATIEPDMDPCGNPAVSVYRSHWMRKELSTVIAVSVPCAYVPDSHSSASVILLLTCISCAVNAFGFIMVLKFKNTAAMKVARVETMGLFLLGSTMLNFSALFSVGEPTETTCILRVVLLLVGFFFFEGVLMLKQAAINNLMRVKYKLDAKKTKKKTLYMRWQSIILTVIAGFWIILWAAIAGFTPEEKADDFDDATLYQTVCPSDQNLTMVIIFFGFIFICSSCVLAWQTRNFKGLIFGEAKQMLFGNWNVAITTAFMLLMTMMDGLTPTATSTFIAACVWFATTLTSILVVGSRVFAAYKDLKLSTSKLSISGPAGAGTGTIVPSDHATQVAGTLAD